MLLENWKTQVKKGYLELCLLQLIRRHKRLYGLELIEKLGDLDLPVKEGTLYPLLSRLSEDGLLGADWETETKGHPRKFYSLTKDGAKTLTHMEREFHRMVHISARLK